VSLVGLLAQVAPEGEDRLPQLRLPEVEYSAMVPHLILLGAPLVLLLVASLLRKRLPAGTYAAFTALSGLASGVAAWLKWRELLARDEDSALILAVANAIVVDGFACFMMIVISLTVVLGALLADSYLRREGLDGPEFYVLMMLSAAGGLFMATANDLIVLFLGLEILSIALYVLTGYHRRRAESREAAMKYFILGAFSSALFLYGIALVYGATGSTNLVEISSFLASNVIVGNGLLMAGLVLLLVGLGFKVAAVPFHAWTPDVYQGAPSPVTGFMAAAAKAAGFAGLLRVFFSTFGDQQVDWQPLVWALAVLTMLTGSVLAVVQSDIKRMLAYSSISHAGYVLIGLQAATERGIAGSLYYLLAYTFMVLGSFAIVSLVGRKGDAEHDLEHYKGLSARRPILALAFTVLLMAQAGIPFTTGFLAKFYVIGAAVQAESYALALIGMVSAVIAAFFYLRVIVVMYSPLEEGAEAGPRIRLPFGTGLALGLAVAFTVAFGIVPQPIIQFARQASERIF
jgi:NADH-quinone oxidoreductase subunit N